MGLFKKAEQEIPTTRDMLEDMRIKSLAVYAMADVFDKEVLQPGAHQRGLYDQLMSDFALFCARLAQVDGAIDQIEVAEMNHCLGTDYSVTDFNELIASLGTDVATRTIPESFVTLRDHRDCCISADIARAAVEVFEMLGNIVSGADGVVDREEKWEINGYVSNLRHFLDRE